MKTFVRRMRWIALILTLVATAIFVVQNAAVIELQFLTVVVETRRAFVVAACLLIGWLVGWLFGASRR